jgi:alginate O-acetyltransferase complex protein AlgI
VAIGFARLLGFRVMENFNAPLIRQNIQQFWASWHISLTSWCREYVYMPIFSLTRARWLGILGAMAILGLWHEFTARYLAWGVYNGFGILGWHLWRQVAGQRMEAFLAELPILRAFWTVASVLLTLHFVFMGFVLVQNETLAGGLRFWQALLGF